MANEKHTPGPWLHGGPVRWESIVKFPSVGNECWEVGPADAIYAEAGIGIIRNEADARLIAAAPDLLAVVRASLRHLESGTVEEKYEGEHADALRAAITKAARE